MSQSTEDSQPREKPRVALALEPGLPLTRELQQRLADNGVEVVEAALPIDEAPLHRGTSPRIFVCDVSTALSRLASRLALSMAQQDSVALSACAIGLESPPMSAAKREPFKRLKRLHSQRAATSMKLASRRR